MRCEQSPECRASAGDGGMLLVALDLLGFDPGADGGSRIELSHRCFELDEIGAIDEVADLVAGEWRRRCDGGDQDRPRVEEAEAIGHRSLGSVDHERRSIADLDGMVIPDAHYPRTEASPAPRWSWRTQQVLMNTCTV